MNKIFFAFCLFFSINSAYAYLDPGSGSIIIQAIIGVIASLIFFIKMFWFKIKKIFKSLLKKLFH